MPKRSRKGVVEQAGAGGGADQREMGEVDLHGTRRRPGADDEVELEILHRRIEDLFDRRIEAMDFIDKQNVARLQIGELGGKVAGFGDDRPGRRTKIDAELARHDLRQRRLAEARRADEKHVIERALLRERADLDEDLQIASRRLLTDEIGEDLRTQRRIDVLGAFFRRDEAARRIGHCASSFSECLISAAVVAATPSELKPLATACVACGLA